MSIWEGVASRESRNFSTSCKRCLKHLQYTEMSGDVTQLIVFDHGMQKGLGSIPSPTQTGVMVQAGDLSIQEEETMFRNSRSFLAT